MALVFQAQGHGAVAFDGHNELLPQFGFDEGHVLLGREPVVGQHMAVAQLVVLAYLQHLAQLFVFGDETVALELAGCHLAIRQVLADDLKRHRQAGLVRAVQAVEDVHAQDPSGWRSGRSARR